MVSNRTRTGLFNRSTYIESNTNWAIQCDVELEQNFLIVLEQNISFNINSQTCNMYYLLYFIIELNPN